MFVILTAVSITIGVVYYWSNLIGAFIIEDPAQHWAVICVDLIYFAIDVAYLAFFFVIVMNLAYYGIKSIFPR